MNLDASRGGLAALLVLLALPPAGARTPVRCAGKDAPGPQVTLITEDEPGERLVVRGRVLAPDGATPLQDARIQVFQTDAAGYYSPGGMDEEHPRLCGLMRTGPDGAYEFHTVLPGAYATDPRVRPHIHYRVRPAEGRDRSYLLQFSREGGDAGSETWDTVRPLVEQDGVLTVTRDIRIPG
ncbi:MAG: hypothetical protein PVF68_03605 [Acidobacteriota bacterium]|jgi:hypothetical protein